MGEFKMRININEKLAEEILITADAAFNEGLGGDIDSLLLEIKQNFPNLANKYSWLYDAYLK